MSQADAVIAALVHGIRQARSDVIVEVTANLMEPADEGGTPVDTGWARANWIPSVGVAVDAPVGSEGSASSAIAAQQGGLASVAAYTGPDPVFVANAVPYIQRLNDGWSKQAPLGFVERAVDKAEATLQHRYDSTAIDASSGAGTSATGAAGAGNLAEAYSPFGGDE